MNTEPWTAAEARAAAQTHVKWLVNALGHGLVQSAGGIVAPLDVRSSTEDVLENTKGVRLCTSCGRTLSYKSSMDKAVSTLFSNFTCSHVERE